jgi:hypothetical protein
MKLEKDKNIEDSEIKSLMKDLEEVGLGSNIRLSVRFAINSNEYLYTNSDILVQRISRTIRGESITVKHYEVAKTHDFRRWYQFIIEGPELSVDKFYRIICDVNWIDRDSQEILSREYY